MKQPTWILIAYWGRDTKVAICNPNVQSIASGESKDSSVITMMNGQQYGVPLPPSELLLLVRQLLQSENKVLHIWRDILNRTNAKLVDWDQIDKSNWTLL